MNTDQSSNHKQKCRLPCEYGGNCNIESLNHHQQFTHPLSATKRESTEPISESDSKKPKLTNANNSIVISSGDDRSIEAVHPDELTSELTDTLTSSTIEIMIDKVIANISFFEGQRDVCLFQHSRSSSSDTSKQKVANPLLNKKLIINTGVSNYSEANRFIKTNFLVDMPDDFYDFWEFCKQIYPTNPAYALRGLEFVLCGPFDVLAGKFNNGKHYERKQFLNHWRFYYDPPEFQTVIRHIKTGYHMGYFRDDPETSSYFIAAYDVFEGCEMTALGDNIFAALKQYLDINLESMNLYAQLVSRRVLTDLETKCADYLNKRSNIEAREMTTSCKTFHNLGLVVPIDKPSQFGYRKLPISDEYLRSVLYDINAATTEHLLNKAILLLKPIIKAAHVATEQYDYGTALELAINIFCHGGIELNTVALFLFKIGYTMINRGKYYQIIETHLNERKMGNNLSMFEHEYR